MKATKLLGTLLVAAVAVMLMTSAADVHAQARKKQDAAALGAPLTKAAVALPLAWATWGQSPKMVAESVDKLLDEDYRPRYKEVQPGVKMKELDAQLAQEKNQFRRSRIDFGKIPTGIDATPLRGEYTYNNKEAVLILTRKGMRTYFFFIQDRLWKIIDEPKLGDGSPLGRTYPEAVVKLSTNYGVPGRVLPPEGSRSAVEVDWKTATTHVRAIQRGAAAIALGYEDNATLANLAALRVNKAADNDGIDPDVAAALRGTGGNVPAPPDKDKKK